MKKIEIHHFYPQELVKANEHRKVKCYLSGMLNLPVQNLSLNCTNDVSVQTSFLLPLDQVHPTQKSIKSFKIFVHYQNMYLIEFSGCWLYKGRMLAFQNMFYVFVNIKLGSAYTERRIVRARLYWCENESGSDITSRWIHSESNFMFILSNLWQRKNWFSLKYERTLKLP